MKLINKLKKFPRLYFFLRDLKRIFREAIFPEHAPRFKGWYGMTLHTDPPWISTDIKKDSLEHQFSIIDSSLKQDVKAGTFKLIQFDHYNLDTQELLNELTWRHYIVYWSSNYAALNTKSNLKGMVEVGVADGLTLNYAFNAMINCGSNFKGYLYDTWDEVELINPSTKGSSSEYEYLDLDSTKNNLKNFQNQIIFKKGFIPDTFTGDEEPETIAWLHIDLNSSPPTLETLDYFWDRLESGGIVLFDDYAQPSYIDTKQVVDKWLSEHSDGIIIQLPTSQAIIFKI